MRIATWNLNNRVGMVRFRPEAANAAITIDADIIVFTEYYPQAFHANFCATLRMAGWGYQLMSVEVDERANRILIAAKCPLEPIALNLPGFDRQFRSNILNVYVPSIGLSIMGIRVPWYAAHDRHLIFSAWDWIEATGSTMLSRPAIILGDLNASLKSGRARGGDHLRNMLEGGWHRAVPTGGASFLSTNGQQSEIDHILGTLHCEFSDTEYVVRSGDFQLAGEKNAISDHAALITNIKINPA